MATPIRIVVLGDEKVGKTSIVSCIIREEFEDQVPSVMPVINVSPDITDFDVPIAIVDTSSKLQDQEFVIASIQAADVAIVVHDVKRPETFERVRSFWLPLIRSVCNDANQPIFPVVIVGNKIDLRGYDLHSDSMRSEVEPLMTQFKDQIEVCLECTAKMNFNIHDVFSYAQKAVLFPIRPIFDSETNKLTEKCSLALGRIFKLIDTDKDGLLNDSELNDFHRRSFQTPLPKDDLFKLKDLIRRSTKDGVNENSQCITLTGFLCLQHLFIHWGRLVTTWKILRGYGYDDTLELSEEFLAPSLEVPPDHTVELNKLGIMFLIDLFQRHARTNSSFLTHSELEQLFSTAPQPAWDRNALNYVATDTDTGHITLQGFLSQWALITQQDYRITLRYLAYLGYSADGDKTKCLSALPRHLRRARTVFSAYVFGSQGCGKTTALNGVIGKKFSSFYRPTTSGKIRVCNIVNLEGDASSRRNYLGNLEKFLLLTEFSREEDIVHNPEIMKHADTVIFLWDQSDPHSFAYSAKLHLKVKKQYPTLHSVFFSTKNDLSLASQKYKMTPKEYYKKNNLPLTHPTSFKIQNLANMYITALHSCLNESFLSVALHKKPQGWLYWVGSGIFLSIITAGVFIGRTHFLNKKRK